MRFFQKIDKKALEVSAYIVLTVGIAYALILLIGQYKTV